MSVAVEAAEDAASAVVKVGSGAVSGAFSAANGILGGKPSSSSSKAVQEDDPEEIERKQLELQKNRSKEELERIKRRKEKKQFIFRLNTVVVEYDSPMEEAFLEFVIGGISREEAETKTVRTTKKEKGADGKEEEKEITEEVTFKKVVLKKENALRAYTKVKAKVESHVKCVYNDFDVVGVWEGTYEELEQENLEVIAWSYTSWNEPNRMIGKAKENLLSISKSKMDREILIYEGSASGTLRRNAPIAARVMCHFEFQETFDFVVHFQDWALLAALEDEERKKEEAAALQAADPNEAVEKAKKKKSLRSSFEEMKLSKKEFTLNFNMFNTHEDALPRYHRILNRTVHDMAARVVNTALLSCRCTAWMLSKCFDQVNPEKLKWAFSSDTEDCNIQLRNGKSDDRSCELHYHGTRSQLEDEMIDITLYKSTNVCGCCGFNKKIWARKQVPIQGVLDVGYLVANLDRTVTEDEKKKKLREKMDELEHEFIHPKPTFWDIMCCRDPPKEIPLDFTEEEKYDPTAMNNKVKIFISQHRYKEADNRIRAMESRLPELEKELLRNLELLEAKEQNGNLDPSDRERRGSYKKTLRLIDKGPEKIKKREQELLDDAKKYVMKLLDLDHFDKAQQKVDELNKTSIMIEIFEQKANLQMDDLDLEENIRVARFRRESELREEVKGVVKSLDTPLFRQLGNLGAAIQTSMFAPRKIYHFMNVKLIRAKLRSLDDSRETLNSNVTIEWGGMRKTSKTVAGEVEPFFDEELSFMLSGVVQDKVPATIDDFGKAKRRQQLTISCWDNDGLCRTPLGHCHIDFETIYRKRVGKTVTPPGQRSRRLYVATFKEILNLPNLRVEKTDYEEPPKRSITSDDKKTKIIDECFIEFEIYLDRIGDSQIIREPIVDETFKSDREKDDSNPFGTLETDEFDPNSMNYAQRVRARAVWMELTQNVPSLNERFFSVMGKDEFTGGIHFLPRFLKPMHPPSEVTTLDKLLYFVTCIEHIKRPADDDDLQINALRRKFPHLWVWADPYYLLEKRKGDVKDHAVLLCNFLLGVKDGMDAYVCIGSVKPPNSRVNVPHVWVMTLESEVVKEIRANDPEPHEFIMRDENNQPRRMQRFIRFWETTTGKTFRLDGKDRFGKPTDKAVADQFSVRDLEQKKSMKNKASIELEEEAANRVEEDARRPMEEDEPSKEEQPDTSAVTLLGELDDSYIADVADDIKTKESAIYQSKNVSIFEEASLSRVEKQRVQLINQSKNQDPLKIPELEKKKQSKSAKGIPYVTIDVIFNHEVLYANLQQADPELISYNLRDPSRWATFPVECWSEFVRTIKVAAEDLTKASSSNIQDQDGVMLRRITTSTDAKETFVRYPLITPFYPHRPLPSLENSPFEIVQNPKDKEKQTKGPYELMELEVMERLKSAVVSYREYERQTETDFYAKFNMTNGAVLDVFDYLRERLEKEEEHFHNVDLWEIDKANQKADDERKQKQTGKAPPEKIHVPIEFQRRRWMKPLIDSLDHKTRYLERLMLFKYSEGNKISDAVLRQAKDLLDIAPSLNPRYALGVKLERLPSLVTPIRVLLVVTCDDPQVVDKGAPDARK